MTVEDHVSALASFLIPHTSGKLDDLRQALRHREEVLQLLGASELRIGTADSNAQARAVTCGTIYLDFEVQNLTMDPAAYEKAYPVTESCFLEGLSQGELETIWKVLTHDLQSRGSQTEGSDPSNICPIILNTDFGGTSTLYGPVASQVTVRTNAAMGPHDQPVTATAIQLEFQTTSDHVQTELSPEDRARTQYFELRTTGLIHQNNPTY